MLEQRAGSRIGLVVLTMFLAGLACSGQQNANAPKDTADAGARTGDGRIALVAPAEGSRYAIGARVEFYAAAHGAPDVIRLAFRVDGQPVGETHADDPIAQTPLAGGVLWSAAQPGTYELEVEGFRADGTSAGTASIAFEVIEAPGVRMPPPAEYAPPLTPTTAPRPTAIPTNTPARAAPAGVAVRANTALNVREGPGTQYTTIGGLSAGDSAPLVGRSEDGTWWAITYDGATGWVFAGLTTASGDTAALPVMTAP